MVDGLDIFTLFCNCMESTLLSNIFPSGNGLYEAIRFRMHDSTEEKSKTRATLTQNLFSFLREGFKTVSYADKHVLIDNSQFLLLSAGNCLMTERIAPEAGAYRSTMLFFDNAMLSDFFLKYSHLLPPVNQQQLHEEAFIVFIALVRVLTKRAKTPPSSLL